MALKAVWDLNQYLLYSQNPKCYNIVMSVFRIAESDLGSDFKSNLAPTEIYMDPLAISTLFQCEVD